MLLPFSECQKIPCDMEKDKISEKYNSGLISKRVKPVTYEELKAVHKWFLILRSENVPISGPMLKEKALEFAGGLRINAKFSPNKVLCE